MKTTVEISDALLKEAHKVAAREGRTVRAMVKQGLRQVLEQHKAAKAFRLHKATFKGNGIQPAVSGAS
jgi:predicted transcriptional regulator